MEPIRKRTYRPSGHRELHEPIAETDKAVRFRYYAWFLWIPRSALVKVGSTYTAPAWAIDSAREHESARSASPAIPRRRRSPPSYVARGRSSPDPSYAPELEPGHGCDRTSVDDVSLGICREPLA